MKTKNELTDEMVLAKFEPGEKLTVRKLTARLEMRQELVRKKLMRMLVSGSIQRERDKATAFFVYFAGTGEVEKAPISEFEIALPRITHQFDIPLTGYQAELNRRQSLCLSIRRAA